MGCNSIEIALLFVRWVGEEEVIIFEDQLTEENLLEQTTYLCGKGAIVGEKGIFL